MEKKRVLLVSLPEMPRCGIADFSRSLAEEISKSSDFHHDTFLFSGRRWSSFFLAGLRCDCLLFQYPSRIYRFSLMPLILFFLWRLSGKKIALVLHENSQVFLFRKVVNFLMMLLSQKIVITNDFELDRLWKPFKSRASVIGVGTNIVPQESISRLSSNNNVLFFGLIRRDKGVENFLELCKKNSEVGSFCPILVGSVVDPAYWEQVKVELERYGIEYHLGLDDGQVSEIFRRCSYAVCIFPDGVSERRTSFLAALSHGLIVFGNVGEQTSSMISGVVKRDSFEVIQETIKRCNVDRNFYQNEIHAVRTLAGNFSWKKIGHKYRILLSSILNTF